MLSISDIFFTDYFVTLNLYRTCSTFEGPPSRPEGPLKVSNVTKDSAKLSWDKPKDDGGLDIRCVPFYLKNHT